MTIQQQLEHIANDICDTYCKFPAQYDCSDDTATDKLIKEHCDNCPLMKLWG